MSAQLNPLDDPAIPTLAVVLDPVQLGGHLSQAWPLATKVPTKIQVRMLRYHPGKRCVVEIILPTPQGSHSLIGKVYATDRSDVYQLMRAISAEAFGPGESFAIPQAIAYLPSLSLLLQEKVEGKAATESFLSNDESERARASERCATWLARFHSIVPRIGPSLPIHNYLDLLEQWSRRLVLVGKPLADKSKELFQQLQGTASLLRSTEMRTIHGDFTHHQVLFQEDRTVTVDWDKYGLGDPIRDLATFSVGLERLALRSLGSMRSLDEAAAIFLNTYAAIHRSDLTARLAFHKAAICLEHAKHDVHKQAGAWRNRAEATLDEGLRILKSGA